MTTDLITIRVASATLRKYGETGAEQRAALQWWAEALPTLERRTLTKLLSSLSDSEQAEIKEGLADNPAWPGRAGQLLCADLRCRLAPASGTGKDGADALLDRLTALTDFERAVLERWAQQ
jgi:hypothetical protein